MPWYYVDRGLINCSDERVDGRVDGRTMGRTTGRSEKSADGLTDHLIRIMF